MGKSQFSNRKRNAELTKGSQRKLLEELGGGQSDGERRWILVSAGGAGGKAGLNGERPEDTDEEV